jgi:S-layer protein
VKSDAIESLTVVDASSSAAVTISNSGVDDANDGEFNLTVGNSTVTVTNDTATTVNIASTSTAYQSSNGTAPYLNTNALTLSSAAATALNFSNANTVTLTASSQAKVVNVTHTGSGKVALGSVASGWGKLTSIDASQATGALTVTLGNTPTSATTGGMTVLGGSGADVISIAGSGVGSGTQTNGGIVTTTIKTGAGNDSVVKSGSGAVSAGAVIDAGEGSDILGATLVNVGNAAIFENFERINVTGGTDGGSLDASMLTNSTITGVVIGGALSATTANTFAVTGLAGTALTVDVTASNTNATFTTALASSAGTSDSAQINFAQVAVSTSASDTEKTTSLKGVKMGGIESVSISSGGAVINAADFDSLPMENTLTLFTDSGNTTKEIVITGANSFQLGGGAVTRNSTTKAAQSIDLSTNSPADGISQYATSAVSLTDSVNIQSALTSIDASSMTGNAVIWAGTSDNINDGDTNQKVKYDGLVIKTGSGLDAVVNAAKLGQVITGDGADYGQVTGLYGSINAGAGDDILKVATRAIYATLTGGEGKDTFDVTGALAGASGTSAITNPLLVNMTSITDLEVGDKIKLAGTVSDLVDGTTAIAAATTLLDALDKALKITTDVAANDAVTFQYGGNTYIAWEDSTDGISDGDTVVKLTGLYDTDDLSLASNVITAV